MSEPTELQRLIQHHDREITHIRADVAGLNQRMQGVESILHGLDVKFDKMVQVQAAAQASKPGQVLDAVRTALSIMSTMAFLTGAVVAAVVYVSSNANNSDITLLKWRVEKVEQTVMPWVADVRRTATDSQRH